MQTSHTGVSRTRQVVAAVIGNALEWYDFIVYGFLASIIARQFFPSEDEYASLLMALATFGVGFFMRPVGGILLGIYSDRKGRKAAMQLIIRLMTVSIALIAFAPNYAAIGMGAPLLIVVARMLQGFATGGEYASATAFLVESAPAHRKGLYGSWQLVGQCLAVFGGAAMVAMVTHFFSPQTLDLWGWRLPFVLGLLIGPVGLWIRRHMEDPEEFIEARRQATGPAPSLMQVIREHRRSILVSMGLACGVLRGAGEYADLRPQESRVAPGPGADGADVRGGVDDRGDPAVRPALGSFGAAVGADGVHFGIFRDGLPAVCVGGRRAVY